jgi:hypothetical protein
MPREAMGGHRRPEVTIGGHEEELSRKKKLTPFA